MTQSRHHWLRVHGRRMDSALRNDLIRRLQRLKRMPCFLHRTALGLLESLTRVPVLVQLEPNSKQETGVVAAEHHAFGFPVERIFDNLGLYSCRLSLRQIKELMERPEVSKVYLDRKVYALLDTASPATRAPLVWETKNRGKGVTIAVVDTGIAPHPDLTQPTNRIIAFKDFVDGLTNPYDDNGHGTHVAGCAAGNGYAQNGKYRGTAPEALLVGVKVLDKTGSGNLSDVIAGIKWCIDHRDQYNIRIISLSLGSTPSGSYRDDPVCRVVEEAWKRGITVVAAAGNSGPESGTIASPGNHPQIITVGASDDRETVDPGNDTIASFSSRGPTADGVVKPDLVAPGVEITSLRVRGSYLDKMSANNRVDSQYLTLSGTSMSTPLVSGIAALILSEHPEMSPDQLKQRLMSTARDLGFSPNEQGRGLVDAARAVSP
ncbi:MAG: S8 family peptidase [Planifilum sp.]|jgi:serine protease AprX